MLRRNSLVVAVGVAMAAMLALLQSPASSATQQERPDASCQGETRPNAAAIVSGSVVFAQTFTAQNTGRLTSVEVLVEDFLDIGNLVVEIRTVDASGAPTQSVLASTSIPASQIGPDPETVRVSFDPGAEVVDGEQYALVLRATEGGRFGWWGSTTNPCPNGQAYESLDGGQSFAAILGVDWFFSAFVTPPPDPRPDNGCTIRGTNGDDVLRGTAGRDVICALGGDDTVSGFGANDVIRGANGRDTIRGNKGNDFIRGNKGRDWLYGNEGKDKIYGGAGRDLVRGGPGRDVTR
jgi:Ca2+-binding RTX toxin-like protein